MNKRRRSFLKSPYFDVGSFVLAAVIAGAVVALFPYHDLSVQRIFTLAVLLVALMVAMLAFVVITWIMWVSYLLDARYSWHKANSARYSRQIILGGLVPLGLILGYEWLFYGEELFAMDVHYFILALEIFLLFLLNERAYLIYLSTHRQTIEEQYGAAVSDHEQTKQDYNLLADKYEHLSQQYKALDESKKELQEQFIEYQHKEQGVQSDILERYMMLENYIMGAAQAKPYSVKIGPRVQYIPENEILGFEIREGVHKKPLIYIRTIQDQSLLTTEDSLDRVHKERYPTYLRLGRQCLVSPRSLIAYTVMPEDKGCWIYTKMAEEPYPINKNKWYALMDRVRLILAWASKAS